MSIPGLAPGYRLDHQMIASLDPGLAGFSDARGRELYRDLLERIRALPGVESASLASMVAFGDERESRQVYLPGSQEAVASPTLEIVGADYFGTLGLRMRSGREFTRSEELGGPGVDATAIVNEPLAQRLFGDIDPLGIAMHSLRMDAPGSGGAVRQLRAARAAACGDWCVWSRGVQRLAPHTRNRHQDGAWRARG